MAHFFHWIDLPLSLANRGDKYFKHLITDLAEKGKIPGNKYNATFNFWILIVISKTVEKIYR